MSAYEWGRGLFSGPAGGMAYVVATVDVTPDDPPPSTSLVFGPGRGTIKWRGKRFNMPRSRVVGIEYNGGRVKGYLGEWAEFNINMPATLGHP